MDTHINIDDNNQVKEKYKKDYLNSRQLPKWVKIVGDVLFFVFTAFALAVAVLACIFVRTPVDGVSMQPTINANWTADNKLQDYVMINRLKKGERGDIIVVQKDEDNENVIKRLIATGGDYVTIAPILDESNNPTGKHQILIIKKGDTTPSVFNDGINDMVITYQNFNKLKLREDLKFVTFGGNDYLYIADDNIFYLGDNRNESKDCSTYGPMKASSIIGKVELIIPYNQNQFKACYQYFVEKIFH